METVIFVIRDAPLGEDYPLLMDRVDDTDPNWHQTAVSASVIPRDVSPVGMPSVTGPTGDDTQIMNAITVQALLQDALDQTSDTERIGLYLFSLLHQGSTGTAWDALRDKYECKYGQGAGIRTVLDIEPTALRTLPWELICDPQDKLRLSALPGNAFYHGRLSDWASSTPTSFELPMRVLIVAGTAEKDTVARTLAQLWPIEDAMRRLRPAVYVRTLVCPSEERFNAEIEQFRPSIFIFFGHGATDSSDRPALRILEPDGTPWYLSGDEIPQRFASCPLQFAYICACQSDAHSASNRGWTIAEAFRRRRVPIVLGMQADLWADAAERFAETLFMKLSNGAPIDEALCSARKAVQDAKTVRARDWGLPSLSLRVRPCPVFPQPNLHFTPPTYQKGSQDEAFLSTFVDRCVQRWTLFDYLDPLVVGESPNGQRRHVAIISGEGDIGKSSLAIAFLEVCALRGRRTHYVDIDGNDKPCDFLGFLRCIVNGNGVSTFRNPFQASDFPRFHYGLAVCRANGEPAGKDADLPAEIPPDDGAPLPHRSQTIIEKLMQAFMADLTALADREPTRPLILVLDRLRVLNEDFRNYIIPHLIDPIIAGKLGSVRLILVAQSDEYANLGLDEYVGNVANVRIDDFDANEYIALHTEYIRAWMFPRRRLQASDAETIDAIVSLRLKLLNLQDKPWKPSDFASLPIMLKDWK
jgi:hypothetical protein